VRIRRDEEMGGRGYISIVGNNAIDLSDSGQKFMIRQIEEGDTKGGIIIPKDKF